jgi:hypothetical protein
VRLGLSGLDRSRWIRALTTAGWAGLIAYLSILAVTIDRARRISQSQFSDGIWGQRVEILSFAAIAQHQVVLGIAAAAAVAAVALAAEVQQDLWLDRLVRAVAGASIAAAVLATAGVIWVVAFGNESIGDFGFFVSRSGGVAMSVAIVRVCLEAERGRQTPSSPSR